MLDETAASEQKARKTEVRTFLIADIRGYTRFSDAYGDEAASTLAHRFAALVRETVPGRGGDLLELRGDEALCVFDSPRAALGAAVELQRRCRERIDGEAALALGVGIGLDTGEAVPTEGGYRGRALNVAARLCSLAKPGEVLASETVATLAGRDDHVRFAARRAARVKGIDGPIRFVEVVSDTPLPPVPRPLQTGARPSALRTRRVLVALAAVAVAAAAGVAALILSGGDGGGTAVPANSVAVINPATNKVAWHVGVGEEPTMVSVAGDRAWILNRTQTISLVDVEDHSLVKTFGVAATPAGIAAGPDGLWVGDSAASSVLRLNRDSGGVLERLSAPPLDVAGAFPEQEGQPLLDAGPLILASGALWFLSGNATLSRIDPAAARLVARIQHKGVPGGAPAYVAAADGVVWVFAWSTDLTRVDPETNGVVSSTTLNASGPIAAGLGSVWIADSYHNQIWQIDPGSPSGRTAPSVVRSITVEGQPIGLAAGAGSLWVANDDGTVSKIDPAAGRVSENIEVGGALGGIYADDRAVWVTVD